jgi:two-component system, OmpR family, sensor histidine kinase KdpD
MNFPRRRLGDDMRSSPGQRWSHGISRQLPLHRARSADPPIGIPALLLILAVAGGGGYLAHANDRPVTAALIFMLGVVLVASRGGLRSGLLAGIAFSVLYNLLLSAPDLRFRLQSLDDFVPLLAFVVSAVTSAYMAGRLRDQTLESSAASERVRSLLEFSQALQRTVSLDSMLLAASNATTQMEILEIHLRDGQMLSQNEEIRASALNFQLGSSDVNSVDLGDGRIALVERFSEGAIIGVAASEHATESAAYLAILAIAAERWALTERLVDADVLRRSEEFKTTLLSSVSHDLRTPLSVISASATSLVSYRNELDESTQIDLLQTIQQHADRLNRMTGKLLSLGRIDGGLDSADMLVIDALDVLGSAIVAVRSISPARDIRKSYSVDSAPVRADPALLEQVFYNLLENAVVHTPDDTPIRVRTEVAGEDLLVHIDDCGSGIEESVAPRIFERFYQLPSGNGHGKGSGLGLSIARGFARAVGGDVAVGGKPDGSQGSRFSVSLPLESEGRQP